MPTTPITLSDFLTAVTHTLHDDPAFKLTLSQPHLGQVTFEHMTLATHLAGNLGNITLRPIDLKQQRHISFVLHYTTQDITKNLAVAEAILQLEHWLTATPHAVFKQAHLHTASQEWHLRFSKKNKALISRTVRAAAPSTTPSTDQTTSHTMHNQEKQRYLSLDRPFLHHLGVTTAQHQLVPSMARKWKQINKFIEIVAHGLQQAQLLPTQRSPNPSSPKRLDIMDFGAGKGYLTFALHDYLQQLLQQLCDVQVSGIELRPNLVAAGQQTVRDLNLHGLQFVQGDVRDYTPPPLDVMIALHACDIATDHAIHLGIQAGAKLIVCSPCCHQELRPQLKSPPQLHAMLQHGIHAGQTAEMLTDTLRALWLETQGYRTQVFEFIALEHTSKNKMIMAIKQDGYQRQSQQAAEQIQQLTGFYGIETHCLQRLFKR